MAIKFLNTVAVDTDVLYVDASSNNVGIGTTSPERQLSLYSNNTETTPRLLIEQEGTGDAVMAFSLTGGQGWSMGIDNSGGDSFMIHDSSGGVDSSSQFTIKTNGNVGIGTTSPGAKLDVKDGSSAMRFQEYSNGASLFLDGADGDFVGGDYFNISAYGATDLAFGYGAATKMVMKSTGNVGIGTTSPSEKLEVSGGNIKGDGLIQVENSSDNNIIGKLVIDYGSGNNPTLTSVGGVEIAMNANLVMRSNKGIYSDTSSSTGLIIGSERANTPIKFLTSPTTNATYSEAMRIAGDGNVGIGTTSPDTLLQTTNTADGTDHISYEIGNTAVNAGNKGGFAIYELGTKKVTLEYYRDGSAITNLSTPYIFTLDTNSQERMRIDSSGNVGIGTTNPSEKLEVAGNARITGDVTLSNGNALRWTSDDVRIEGTTAGDNIKFYVANTEILQLAQSGTLATVTGNLRVTGAYYDSNNLPGTSGQVLSSTATGTDWVSLSEISGVDGTGTANTVAMWSDSDTITDAPITFSVNNATFAGSIYSGSTIGNLTGGSLGQQLELGNSSITTLRFDADAWRVYAGGSGSSGEALRVTEAGDVGIGQTNPGAKLHITNGNILVNGSGVRQINIESTNDEVRFGLKGNNGNQFRFTSDGTHFKLNDAGKERIKVTNAGDITFGGRDSGNNQATWMILKDQTGNVGIGTTSPVRKLTVNGSANVFDSLLINSNTPTTGATTDAELVIQAKGNQAGTIRSSQWYFQTIPDSIYGNSAFRIAKNYDGGATSEFMRINSAGNIGIGTTSPENKLHVQQSGLYTGIQTTAGIRIKSDGASAIGNYHGTIALSRGTGSVAISAVQERTDSDIMGMAFFTHPSATGGDAAVEQMRIDQNGNVGIGTTNPSAKLEVSDNDTIKTAIHIDNASTGGNRWDIASIGSGVSGRVGNLQIRNDSDTLNIVEITSAGNVGIGTTDPKSKLQVDGGVQMADDTDAASASKVGTLRYRTSGNNSYVDMCMQTGATTYEWVNIVQNNW